MMRGEGTVTRDEREEFLTFRFDMLGFGVRAPTQDERAVLGLLRLGPGGGTSGDCPYFFLPDLVAVL